MEFWLVLALVLAAAAWLLIAAWRKLTGPPPASGCGAARPPQPLIPASRLLRRRNERRSDR